MRKQPIEIRDLLTFKFPENLQYSPSGEYLAFQVAQADEKKNNYQRDVWLVRDGKAKRFTSLGNTSIVAWDDNETLILTRQKEDDVPGVTTLYKMSVNGGEAQEWIKLPFPLLKLEKVEDGRYLALGMINADDADAYKDSEKERKKKLEEKKKNADYQIVDEVPYWFNGMGYINKNRTALFDIHLGKKLEIKRVTGKTFVVDDLLVEDKKVYFAGISYERRMNLTNKIYSYNLNTQKVTPVFNNGGYEFDGLMLMKENLYAQTTDRKEYGINETRNFYRVKKSSAPSILSTLKVALVGPSSVMSVE